ncbi:G5 domain-containing protein [Buchananella hordeovulneris]|uniref:aggregation-promoting factor C-terminal-like domain-containing protein n=1 Tax=Buchananella hordeovulneris TaxID=52770 RepID=UPI0026DB20EF|nr:G5 domain-containing protein [Buchananella hordeovulneris]MDO5079905.1 G5 domain-containing protein [Buchananella hordeovulneris]
MTELENPQQTARRARPAKKSWRLLAAGGAALTLALTGGAIAYSAHKSVTVHVDGRSHAVSTFSGSVNDALAAAGVEVTAHDLVVPTGGSALTDGTVITVKRAQPLHVGGEKVWTTQGTLSAAAAEAGLENYAATRSTSRDALTTLPLVAAGTPVTVMADGKEKQFTAETDLDTAAVLAAAGVEASPIDHVQAAPGDNGAVKVSVVRVKRTLTAEKTEVPFETVQEEDPELEEGTTEVRQAGQAGEKTKQTYSETRDGKAIVSVVLGEGVTKEPVKEIVAVGTKVKAEATPSPSPSTEAPAETEAEAPAAPANPPAPAGNYSGGDPRGIAQSMLASYGWSQSEFGCLDALWERESNWNPYAENPYSGAYGIPQSLPASKMASAGADWATNPATQISWGLSYIAGRYGSPCAAWAHSESVGWY